MRKVKTIMRLNERPVCDDLDALKQYAESDECDVRVKVFPRDYPLSVSDDIDDGCGCAEMCEVCQCKERGVK